MRKHHSWSLAALGATLLLTLVLADPAQSQRPALPQEPTLAGDIATRSGVKEADVAKVLQAMGPAVTQRIAAGQTVELQGLGTIRVVRIAEHKDLVDGRPATIPAVNNIDFVPTGNLTNAANAANAVPAVTVPAFQYNPIQNRVPSTRVPSTRIPSGQ